MIGIILNPRAGYVARLGLPRVRAQIDEALPANRIHVLQQGDDVGAVCRAWIAEGITCIAAAGGDGTVSSVAAHLVDTQTPLGVIPAGTLNHFARDVGVGREVESALRVLAAGYVAAVDVATVNERPFLNNSSVGLYARMVEVRRRYEHRLGKWRALAYAAWLVVRRARASAVSVSLNGTARSLRSYMVFVGNNQYELNLLHLGQRSRLDGGELCCFIMTGSGRLGLLPHIFHYLRDHHPDRRLFDTLTAQELTVALRSRRRHVDVACDGEVFRMAAPLVYRVRPRVLRVVVPVPPPAGSREVRGEEGQITRLDPPPGSPGDTAR